MTDYLIDPDRMAAITLEKGAHRRRVDGMCLMEAVAFLTSEQHTDRPVCVSPVLGEFGRGLNDVLPDDRRQALLAFIPSLPGTAGDGFDEARSYMALDWLIRTWLPAWLDLSPACREDAARVRELGSIVDLVSAERAVPVVHKAGETAAAARDAARDAAWAAARDAAWAAARDAAWAAARDAARDAAWDAARDAARDAAGDAAWAAARDAAGDVLQPTVDELQFSVIDLYAEMIKSPWVLS
jgi:hypothetical protein